MSKGLFVTFEGPEGSGKSTQIKAFIQRLERSGHEVVTTREPGGTPTGEILRRIIQHDESGESICPQTELLLFAASRAQLVDRVIRPALERGACVISDRFMDSTTAYQGYGRQFNLEQVQAINAFAIQDCRPNLTFLLDIPVEESMQRLLKEHASYDRLDTIERESRDFFERVVDGYRDMAAEEPDRWEVIDGTLDPAQIEGIIWRTFEGRT